MVFGVKIKGKANKYGSKSFWELTMNQRFMTVQRTETIKLYYSEEQMSTNYSFWYLYS